MSESLKPIDYDLVIFDKTGKPCLAKLAINVLATQLESELNKVSQVLPNCHFFPFIAVYRADALVFAYKRNILDKTIASLCAVKFSKQQKVWEFLASGNDLTFDLLVVVEEAGLSITVKKVVGKTPLDALLKLKEIIGYQQFAGCVQVTVVFKDILGYQESWIHLDRRPSSNWEHINPLIE